MKRSFPIQQDGVIYLSEGGQETELMYKFGHELPEFAMYPLLDNPRAVADLTGMYQRYLDVAVRHGCTPLMGGLDYRASPDWAAKLGLSRAALADLQHRSIGFLRDVARPYAGQMPDALIVGTIGPRGDAYALNRTITADEAEDYHSVQLETLVAGSVDLVNAMTFNNVAEAVGVARAAARAGLPLLISFTLDSNRRLKSGPTLKAAIERVDAEAGEARPAFYGVNCSHPLEFGPALEPGAWLTRIRSLRPNAAMMDKQQLCSIGHLVDGDPPTLGEQMAAFAAGNPHIYIWGGCCGTWERHLDHIAANVLAVRGARPS